jgi:hypothetical protein
VISDSIAQVYGEVGLRRLAEEQKTKLLPQLLKKQSALVAKRDAINEEAQEVVNAIAEIDAGRITSYQLRKTKEKATE